MIRVDPSHPCPICEKGKWCAFTEDGEYIACKRVQQGSITNLGQFGYLHKIDKVDLKGLVKNAKPLVDWKSLQQTYKIQLSTYGQYPSIGFARDTYDQYFCGWNGKGWTFPVWDDKLSISGMQVRYPDGTKCSVTGTRIGVFVPRCIDAAKRSILCITEGLTDAMVSTEFGIPAIGKWNCDSTHEIVLSLILDKIKPSRIIMVSDNDDPGKQGAKELYKMIKTYQSGLHITGLVPPDGIKDLREWKSNGLTREQFYKMCRIKLT
jgi:hypothetical protein